MDVIKRRVIAFVVILVSVVPVISTIIVFSQEVDFQSQWSEIVLSIIYNYADSCFIISFDSHSNEVT